MRSHRASREDVVAAADQLSECLPLIADSGADLFGLPLSRRAGTAVHRCVCTGS